MQSTVLRLRRRLPKLPRRLKSPLLLLLLGLLLLGWWGWGGHSPRRGDRHSHSLKDWHDYAAIEADSRRSGLGEGGRPASLPASASARQKADLFQANGFNALLSDSIALDRSIPDLRYPECRSQLHYRRLPTAALVIPFHEEHLSTLLRTAVSCRARAPPQLLTEIILVDDASQKPALGGPLEAALAKHFPQSGFARVLRAPKREGLIRARMRGIAAVTADVVIVMDSHCECGVNWLPPLLHPIAEDYRTVVCPFIDVIDQETFEIRSQDTGARGSWSWNSFHYKRLPLLSESLRHRAEPFASPVMAGGLFAMTRRWFNELGGYDSGLDIWGGEQYELSFKIWQCGGRMLDAPCSRVAHIYRNFMPYKNPSNLGDFITRNFKRVAEVWMDEYKEQLYSTNNEEQYRLVDAGDLTKQRAIRERLKCHNFEWYMKNVAFDQPKFYPYRKPAKSLTGFLKAESANRCVAVATGNSKPSMTTCGDGGGATLLHLSERDEIRVHASPPERCFDVPDGRAVQLFACHGMRGNQYFKYFPDIGRLRHVPSSRCVALDSRLEQLALVPCSKADSAQRWAWVSAA
ncbi:hypothetical protein BOX15_Mlig018143g1 [Macrostomum lignano]|uniref:Polypeptide N-acetylgalactosaminyltransferase n=1 Tax=Macrostomum lignano TaxID=282301 RepID=A0A267H610_9PLAT|nr:hypothetical protein BOX15_Mlig018143g1 [Macrostomum lignano]